MRNPLVQQLLNNLKKPTWSNFKIKLHTQLYVIKCLGIVKWLKIKFFNK